MSLRDIIEAEATAAGESLTRLSVLAAQNDPYRIDTPTFHEAGGWFAEQLALHPARNGQTRHLRGLHYALLGGTTKPNGLPFTNTQLDWQWLVETAAKAARWLGYIEFDAIRDARNGEPIIRIRQGSQEPYRHWNVSASFSLEDHIYTGSNVALLHFEAEQPYRLAFFGEKWSLEPTLSRMADRCADLFLATGEISDTLIYAMARAASTDGRKLIVFTVSDFDPAGHQMPISIARKLQAFGDLKFPNLSFEVHPVALTYEQVVEFDLPSEPLKETERRGNKWRDAWGRDQTEIDALIEKQPEALVEMIEDAVAPFYDSSLAGRVRKARERWEAEARERLDAVFDESVLEPFEVEALAVVEQAKADLTEIEQRAKAAIGGVRVKLPSIPDLPEPDVDGTADDLPLIDSDWSWIEQTKAPKDHKRYGGEE